MKLGTETGSLVNHLYSGAVNGEPKPTVGMGATILRWTDRHAGTVTEVVELCSKQYDWEIKVVRDDAKIVSGDLMSGNAKYEYSPGTGTAYTYLKKSKAYGGAWVAAIRNQETGKWNTDKGSGLRLGVRDEHHDVHF